MSHSPRESHTPKKAPSGEDAARPAPRLRSGEDTGGRSLPAALGSGPRSASSECCGESNAYLLRLPDAFISAPGARDPLRRCWVRPKTSKEPVRRAGLRPASIDALRLAGHLPGLGVSGPAFGRVAGCEALWAEGRDLSLKPLRPCVRALATEVGLQWRGGPSAAGVGLDSGVGGERERGNAGEEGRDVRGTATLVPTLKVSGLRPLLPLLAITRACWGDPMMESARHTVGLVVAERARPVVCRWQTAATGEPDGVPLPPDWGDQAPVGAVRLKLRWEKGCPRKDLSTEARDRARGLEADGLVAVRSAAAMAPPMTD